MNNGNLQLALRDLRTEFRKPVVWVILCGVGLVMAVAGAFGTAGVLRPIPLGLYWIVVVILTYAGGSFVNAFCGRQFSGMNRWVRIFVTGVFIGVVVIGIILGVNSALFGWTFDAWQELVQFAGMVLCVTIVVNLVLNIAFEAISPVASATAIAPPPLLDRMPFELRGPILHLQAEDHYTKVTTAAGADLILIRFADAVLEAAPTVGLQTHRSHWVAKQAITDVRRQGDGAVITILGGAEIPVSRSKMAAIKEAGLL